MSPVPVTEDYYIVLAVEQSAKDKEIVASYKKLALQRHPDRNKSKNATAEFQLLQQAYETLSDTTKRAAYDLIYSSIRNTHTPRQPSKSNPIPQSELEQILLLQKLQQERDERWRAKKHTSEAFIFEQQRSIRRLEHEIKSLKSIAVAEAAEDAQKNSWSMWLLSPLYKKAEEDEEQKARKDRGRQERRIEKDMKERRLASMVTDLVKERTVLTKGQEEMNAAEAASDRKIHALQEIIRNREAMERVKRYQAERERAERDQQEQREQQEKRDREQRAQQGKQDREAFEAFIQRHAEERKRQQEQARDWQRQHVHSAHGFGNTRKTASSACQHGGWWPKVQGRANCPECGDSWTYLLQCPGCQTNACPKCQAGIRRARYSGKTFKRERTGFDSDSYEYFD